MLSSDVWPFVVSKLYTSILASKKQSPYFLNLSSIYLAIFSYNQSV
jgi:hypothetical protein